MKKIKLGVIGMGRLGSIRAHDIATKIGGAELTAVCDALEKRVDEAGEKYSVTKRYTKFEELLDLDELDGVVISNSSDQHWKVICAAAERGKHIFCEKPIALTRVELSEIGKIIRGDKIFQVGFTKRLDSDYETMKQIIARGEIGKPVFIKCLATEAVDDIEFYKDFCPHSGGMIFDIAIHDIDLVRWLTGQEASSVYAIGGVFGYEEIQAMQDIDNYFVALKMENGIMAELEGQRNPNSEFIRQVEILGTDGAVTQRVDEKGAVTVSGKTSTRVVKNEGGMNAFIEKYGEFYTRELREFVNSVHTGGAPPAGFHDGEIAVEIAINIYRSLSEAVSFHSPSRYSHSSSSIPTALFH